MHPHFSIRGVLSIIRCGCTPEDSADRRSAPHPQRATHSPVRTRRVTATAQETQRVGISIQRNRGASRTRPKVERSVQVCDRLRIPRFSSARGARAFRSGSG